MSGVWVGQTRCHALWVTIDKYVTQYITEHNVEDQSWYNKWHSLVHEDLILDKDRHFQFVAFKITGNPDSNVHDCLLSLFQLIPHLSSRIEILDSNEKGNIQYIINSKKPVEQTSDNNPYQSLQISNDEDDESTNNSHQQPPTDESIPLNIRNISPITSKDNTPTRIFKNAYVEATTATHKI